MKKTCIPLIILTLGISDALAALSPACDIVDCSSDGIASETNAYSSDCSGTTTRCYKNSTTGQIVKITSCTSCSGGVALQSFLSHTSKVCGMTMTYDDCGCGTECNDCASDTGWTIGNIGYEYMITRTCDESTSCLCKSTYNYRCASGYYGSSTDGTTGCTRCPSSGGVYGTSAAGSTAITSCYIPANSSMSDTTGTYTFTSNCYYSN